MAVISIINQKKLEGSKRIDAEFYQPIFIRERKRLQSIKNIIILQKVAYITDGQHGYHIVDEKSNIRHITAKNVKEGIVLDHEADRLSILTHKKNQRSALEENDVLLTTAGTIGIAGIVTSRILPANIDQDVARIHVFNKTVLNPFYLTAFLLSEYGQLQIRFNTTGQDRQHLALEKIKQLKIPYFKIQDIIGNEIYKAINRFILSEEFYTQAEQLLLSELGLHDWKPRHTLTYVRSFSQVKQANRMDAEHFQPKYEEVLARIHQYSPKPITSFGSQVLETIKLDENKIYRYIEISDVNTATGEVEFTERVAKELPANAKIKVEGGELVVSKVRPTRGAIGVIPNECRDNGVCSNAFVVLKIPSPEREFLQVYLRSTIGKTLLEKPCKGTSYPTINDNDVKLLPVPTIAQSKIEQISHLVQQSHTARRESKTLLEKAKRAVEIAIEEGEERALEFLS
ncbi:MAG: hypothetical protein GX208_06820 [Firmicutes bacterium]|nr:hypothetical protein [Bacillota bacterium]